MEQLEYEILCLTEATPSSQSSPPIKSILSRDFDRLEEKIKKLDERKNDIFSCFSNGKSKNQKNVAIVASAVLAAHDNTKHIAEELRYIEVKRASIIEQMEVIVAQLDELENERIASFTKNRSRS